AQGLDFVAGGIGGAPAATVVGGELGAAVGGRSLAVGALSLSESSKLRAEVDSTKAAASGLLRSEGCDGAHPMLLANPSRDGPLLDAERQRCFLLRAEVVDERLVDVHASSPYRNACNPTYRDTCLQRYRRAFQNKQMDLKDRLKAARRHANLTQAELAQRVGITQVSISDIERGKTESTGYIAQIAAACGVSPLWLADG